ncbi:Transport permease protein [Hyphomicrobiales bacterium]|nr:Transport permease protein [Hyphomicrobiales bacterium]CAH1698131.1 Transport permease protein [Hyphomicrobiales bacterium]CAI0347774.1 Transport permease protein [Hyphomicrobiales bacterium]
MAYLIAEQGESTPDAHQAVIEITADAQNPNYWRDVWQHRELFQLLVWRDLVVRYKQTLIGFSWSVIRPLTMMIVFTIVFGGFAQLPSNDSPYALLVFTGLLPWMFFATTFAEAGNSVIANAPIVSKVYFPKIILPISCIFVGVVDFIISFFIYFLLALYFKHPPGINVLFLPVCIILLCLFVMACGTWIAALNVRYRDFRYLLPVVLQLGAYMSPVGYASSVVPGKWGMVFALNPMVGIIDGFRWSLLDTTTPFPTFSFSVAVVFTIICLIPGVRFFMKSESRFCDDL